MNEQTKYYRLLPWAVATLIVIVIISAASFFNYNWLYIYSLVPWETAQGVDTVRAINEFGEGIPDTAAHWEGRIAALTGLIVLFVIGPSLWIYSEIQNQAKEITSRDDELKKGFMWYTGVMIVIAGLLYTIPVTAVKGYQFQNTWDSAAKNRNMDELRRDLANLAFDAAEQYYLSYSSENKAGFKTISGKEGTERPITLRDLDSYARVDGSKNSYILAPMQSDSLLTIYGVGYEQGPDPEFENVNGQQGRMQVAVEVNPTDGIFKFVRRNTNMP